MASISSRFCRLVIQNDLNNAKLEAYLNVQEKSRDMFARDFLDQVDYPRLSHCRIARAEEFVHHVTVCARLATWRRVDDMASGCLRFVVGQ